ncbi:hypothetical protein GCM10023115_04100 [Pontixanthobacter gangjinensis]|uniref:Polymer-forming cytoskeletal protein n=1 Tax=Pontixanthobacter gangjinensis TaxID=1028742 RepID=A0A6I4SJ26_9SPHN|nr:polymer-forming cytoskeletal protein [Pontixanthobacter gangjinensis]MXO55663.1 polymer-forming cytoskeletal protein [Pontixanthobacter gangjinensis]
MAGNSTFSVIGADVTITGDVSATTELHVDGRIEGDIKCASLVQGEASVVKGAVEAETARMAGTLKGSISARELVILKTAKIHGDVHYEALTIEQGAVVEGKFAPQSVSKAVAAPKNETRTGGAATNEEEPKLTLAN